MLASVLHIFFNVGIWELRTQVVESKILSHLENSLSALQSRVCDRSRMQSGPSAMQTATCAECSTMKLETAGTSLKKTLLMKQTLFQNLYVSFSIYNICHRCASDQCHGSEHTSVYHRSSLLNFVLIIKFSFI